MRPRATSLLPILVMVTLAGLAGAASGGVVSLLQSYSVPNSLINGLNQVNITYNGITYAVLYSNGQPDFVVNASSNSFVLNQDEIFSIIRNYTIRNSYSRANFSQIAASMQGYINTASAPLADCVEETGLATPGASCTLQNYCEACKTVSYCSRVLNEVGGPESPVGYGFINFDTNYTELEANLTIFFNTINSITLGNINSSMPLVNSSFQSISHITQTIWQNPLFPPSDNITLAQVAECGGAGVGTANTPILGAPWFCNSVEFCPFLTYKDSVNQPLYTDEGFNFTVLAGIASQISSITSLPFSNVQIEAVAAHANTTTTQYVVPTLAKQRSAQLSTLLNKTLPTYPGIVNASSALLTHVNSALLSTSLARLEANYSILVSQYLNINVSKQAALVANQLGSASSIYSKLNATYASLVSESSNNTGEIVRLELDGNANNAYLSSLAFRELTLNSQVSGKVSNTIALQAQLNSVKSGLGGIGSGENFAVSLSRSLGGFSAEALVPGMSLPYSAAVAIAPFLALVPALVIGIVGLVAVALLYIFSKPKKQVALGTRHKKGGGWVSHKVLGVVALILILYIIVSIALSFGDNGPAPISTFTAALSSSKSAVVVLNGTQTSGMLSCYSQLEGRLHAMNEQVLTAAVSGDKCVVSNTTLTTDTCLNSYASRNIPVITLTNSSSSVISAYSFYGTTLQESGNSTALAKCTAAQVI